MAFLVFCIVSVIKLLSQSIWLNLRFAISEALSPKFKGLSAASLRLKTLNDNP